jgi:hypothetical protein
MNPNIFRMNLLVLSRLSGRGVGGLTSGLVSLARWIDARSHNAKNPLILEIKTFILISESADGQNE